MDIASGGVIPATSQDLDTTIFFFLIHGSRKTSAPPDSRQTDADEHGVDGVVDLITYTIKERGCREEEESAPCDIYSSTDPSRADAAEVVRRVECPC